MALAPGQGSDHEQFIAWTAIYSVDDHGLATYGLKLSAGRWFTASEVGEIRNGERNIRPRS